MWANHCDRMHRTIGWYAKSYILPTCHHNNISQVTKKLLK